LQRPADDPEPKHLADIIPPESPHGRCADESFTTVATPLELGTPRIAELPRCSRLPHCGIANSMQSIHFSPLHKSPAASLGSDQRHIMTGTLAGGYGQSV